MAGKDPGALFYFNTNVYGAHAESQLIVAGGSADLGWALPCV